MRAMSADTSSSNTRDRTGAIVYNVAYLLRAWQEYRAAQGMARIQSCSGHGKNTELLRAWQEYRATSEGEWRETLGSLPELIDVNSDSVLLRSRGPLCT